MNSTLSAISEPNRLRIIEMLRERPRTVNEIVDGLGLPQPLVSKHLRVLREAGIVQVRARAQQRVYELRAAPFQKLDAWVGTFRQLWEGRLDRLDGYLQEVKRKQKRTSR